MVYAFKFLNEGLSGQTPFSQRYHVWLLHHLSARKVQKALDIYKEMIGTLTHPAWVDKEDFACTVPIACSTGISIIMIHVW